MVMAEYDSDSTLAELLTSCADTELLLAVPKLYHNFKVRGLQPCLYMLDNKYSALME